MSEKDIINILEVRGVLEGLATGLACKKMGAEGLAELKLSLIHISSSAFRGK